jgi:cytosine deaminase
MDSFMQAAIDEARLGLSEGGIPIGSVLVHREQILGHGHNRRMQLGSAVLHAEIDALENAGRQAASIYRQCTLYTTLSPCSMCSGAILLYGIPRVVIGENRTFTGMHCNDERVRCGQRRAVERGYWRIRTGCLVYATLPEFTTNPHIARRRTWNSFFILTNNTL